MSDSTGNPYKSPDAEAGTINPLSNRVLTEDMLYYLKAASPWLRFLGIVGFIYLGFLLLIFLTFIILGSQTVFSDVPFMAGAGAVAVMVYALILLAVSFFPVLFMFRFGKKIKSYLYSGDNTDLEAAFKNNKSLWTFIGILTIISLGFFVLMLFSGVFAAFVAAFT
jgi:hypothetical protein